MAYCCRMKRQNIDINIDESATTPVYEQLANEMRRLICARTFTPGEQVPSIRAIAEKLNVSPTTVRRAFQMLIDEGWLLQHRGSGTYVSQSIDLQADYLSGGKTTATLLESATVQVSDQLLQSTWAGALSSITAQEKSPVSSTNVVVEIDMSAYASPAGLSAPLPPNALAKYINEAFDNSTALSDPAGIIELRQQIAHWITLARSVRCEASDIMIVSGRRQARSMLARLFAGEGRKVLFEDPTSGEARDLFKSFGWQPVPVPVDDSGIVIEDLEKAMAGNPSAIYLRPSSQFPTGAVLSKMRRERIAEIAKRSNAIIIEDDVGCDFTYESRVTPAVFSMMQNERCVYMGTFSHILPPSWQIAFVVIPPAMREPFYRLKLVADRCTSPVVQNVLLQLFLDGQLQRTVTRLQREYGRLRDELIKQLSQFPEKTITYTPVRGGLHQAVWLPASMDDRQIVDECVAQAVAFTAISPLFASTPARPGVLLNFAAVDENEIKQAVSVLKEVVVAKHGT